jgi:STE24 endopeptidase
MKNVIAFIFDLPDWLTLTMVGLLIVINYIAEFMVKRAVLKVYSKTASPAKAMDKLRKSNQYFLLILQIITIIVIEFLVVKYFVNYGKIGSFVYLLAVPFVFLLIINGGQLVIINKTYQMIRGTTESFSKQLRGLATTILFCLLPITIIVILMRLINEVEINNELVQGLLSAALPLVMIFGFNLILPVLTPKLLKAVHLEDSGLRELLDALFDKAGIKRAKLYQQPTKEKKIANAMVIGLVRPKVFITDYFLENAEPNEVEALVAHEVGHLKQKHILKRVLYIMVGIVGITLMGWLMEWYEHSFGTEINLILGLAILLVPFILYIWPGLLKYYRNQEKKADEFVIDIGVEPEVLIAALLKLAKLNHTATKMKKMDERFQTHPSIARRIRHIEKISEAL